MKVKRFWDVLEISSLARSVGQNGLALQDGATLYSEERNVK